MTNLDNSGSTSHRSPAAMVMAGLGIVWLALMIGERITGKPGLSLFVLLALVLAHGAFTIGGRTFFVFAAVTMTIAFLLEASSIATGFPFGFYIHHAPMPRPLGVPLIVPPTYMAYAYLGWRVACTILRCEEPGPSALRLIGAPLLAAFIIPGFDMVVDPMGSTVAGGWSYAHPSGLFGVPLSNFLGWIFTSWAMIQAYALIEALALSDTAARRTGIPRNIRLFPPVVWIITGLQFAIDTLNAPVGTATVADRSFLVADVAETALITGLFTMVPPALAAVLAILGGPDQSSRR